jgi:hypothetical protein
VLAPAVLALAFACGCATVPGGPECKATPPPSGECWEQLRPLGSGGFPAEPGSNDQPKWSPGKFPLTLVPVPAFNGDLWMISQTHAFSSPDGLTWTQQDKANWGERISQSYAFFRDRLWMFGGLDYASKQPLNDIWSSSDGVQCPSMERAGRGRPSTRPGDRGARAPSSSGTGYGSSAGSTPAATTTGAATSG